MALPGGNPGIAIGAEHRHESPDKPSPSGTQAGSISDVAAKGGNKLSAIYLELLAPLTRSPAAA